MKITKQELIDFIFNEQMAGCIYYETTVYSALCDAASLSAHDSAVRATSDASRAAF